MGIRRSPMAYALVTTAGGNQSPALGVLHEAAHALQWVSNPKQLAKDLASDPQYGLVEERRVITGVETMAAKKLGEDVRTDHGGTDKYVTQSDKR